MFVKALIGNTSNTGVWGFSSCPDQFSDTCCIQRSIWLPSCSETHRLRTQSNKAPPLLSLAQLYAIVLQISWPWAPMAPFPRRAHRPREIFNLHHWLSSKDAAKGPDAEVHRARSCGVLSTAELSWGNFEAPVFPRWVHSPPESFTQLLAPFCFPGVDG